MLHASLGKVVFFEEFVVREDGKNVGEGVSDAKDGFHIFVVML
jgi:hypothetical protein